MKKSAKVIALACATALLTTTIFTDQALAEKETDQELSEQEETLTDTLNSQFSSSNTSDVDKEETVYVFTDANGNTDHILVSDWLKNKTGAKTIEDSSDLKDIENVKGDETFDGSGDKITWNADGSDIYYQGTSTKQSPVSIKLTYYLDDKEVTPEEIAGKSGKVKIRFDYTNNETQEVEVNGKTETIHVPFVVLSGLVLSNDNFKNIEVTNGKLISEGNNSIIAGIAMPGLKDSLQINSKDFDTDKVSVPEYVEITADATDFSLDMTMSMVLSDILDDLSFNSDDIDTSELTDSMDQLTDATDQLLDGTKQLADGTGTLKEKVGEFNDGLRTLDNGIGQYTAGAAQLASGIGELKSGTNQLAAGVPQLTKGVKQLKNGAVSAKKGADQLVAGYAGTDKSAGAASGAKSLASGAKTLDKSMATADQGAQQLKSGADQIVAGYAGDGTAANPGAASAASQIANGLSQLNQAVQNISLPDSTSTTPEQAAAQKQAIREAVTAAMSTPEAQQTIATAVGQVADSKDMQAAIKEAIVSAVTTSITSLAADQVITISGNSAEEIGAKTKTAIGTVATTVGNNINALDISGTMTKVAGVAAGAGANIGANTAADATLAAVQQQIGGFSTQLDTLKASVSQLAAGSAALNQGINSLYDGSKQLQSGITTLASGTTQLSAGASALSDGADALNKGINGYTNAKGEKVTGLYGGTKALAKGLKQLKTGLVTLDSKSATLAAGVIKLNEGASKLQEGAGKLTGNSGTLVDGSAKIVDAGKQLADGVNTLDEGANKLNEGMIEFNEEGIRKLTDAFDGDISSLLDRVNAVMDAGKDYNNFSGVADGKSSSVKFIIKTEGVKAE